jgi:alkanesulfonate monooxygenase SsuD/methylene tetrahydromethanopterin reductase-like flavin-dependent oxidoreductase (luciferase family)
VVIRDTVEDAATKRNAFLAARGIAWDTLDDATRAMLGTRLLVGDADGATAQVPALLDLGLDGFVCNLPADGWIPDQVACAGEVLSKAVAG